jgi:DNA polymerase elongation subunit (family B)
MVVDNYILKENHGKIVFPTRHTRAKQQYAGAIVFNPREPGRHKDVTVMDYTSLYPTSIMAFNISPETFIVSEKSCKKMGIKIEDVIEKLKADGIGYIDTGSPKTSGVPELFGERYLFYDHKYKLGLLPQVLRKLFLQRVEVNRGLKAGEYSGDEAVAMDKRQQAYKLVLNSAYGAMGFNFFRLYRPECADGITFFARQALKFASLKFQQLDHYVLYGDTDSIFVKSNGKSEEQMKETLVEFNDMLRKELVEKYNPGVDDDYMLMDLKFEYDLEYIYFGDSKKRYYSIIRDTGKKYIRGMNIIRKDTPEFMKGALNKIAELAVRGTLTMEHLHALRQKIETVDYKLIGINKKFTKSFDQYTKTMPQHVKASFWANEKLNTTITHSDTPLLFYINSKCEDELKVKQRQQAICLNEEDLHLVDERKDVFEIDYDTFFKKQVLDQLEEFDKIDEVKSLVENYTTAEVLS